MALAPSKFFHLKYLSISIHVHGDYDNFSLVSFLGAAPSLETFILNVGHCTPCKYFLNALIMQI